MPKFNFDDIEDIEQFAPLPVGRYLCHVVEVEEARTKYGDEMWKLRLVVEAGPQRGRYIFDNLVFSDAAMKRVKLVCSRLGLDVAGEIDLEPSAIQGRRCYVTVGIEEYQDQEGTSRRRNVVPFAGYDSAEVQGEAVEDDDPLPF